MLRAGKKGRGDVELFKALIEWVSIERSTPKLLMQVHCPSKLLMQASVKAALPRGICSKRRGRITSTFRNEAGSLSIREIYPGHLHVLADAKYQKSR